MGAGTGDSAVSHLGVTANSFGLVWGRFLCRPAHLYTGQQRSVFLFMSVTFTRDKQLIYMKGVLGERVKPCAGSYTEPRKPVSGGSQS